MGGLKQLKDYKDWSMKGDKYARIIQKQVLRRLYNSAMNKMHQGFEAISEPYKVDQLNTKAKLGFVYKCLFDIESRKIEIAYNMMKEHRNSINNERIVRAGLKKQALMKKFINQKERFQYMAIASLKE